MRCARRILTFEGQDCLSDKNTKQQFSLFQTEASSEESTAGATHPAGKFSNFVVYVDESGDHGMQTVDPDYPIFVLALCVFYKGHYSKKVVRQLTHTPELLEDLAELSPTGSAVAFVRDNNLWLVNCETTEQRQLTKDGSPELLNGILDWVYQEELYGRGNFKAFWWSPDGQQIAFLQLDQTPVPEYMVPDNVSVAQSLERTRYPKAGQPLPTVRAFVIEVRSGETKEINLTKFAADDRLIGRVTWSPTNELWLQVFNRVQNRHELVRFDD